MAKYCTCGRCTSCDVRGIRDNDLDRFLANNPGLTATRGPAMSVEGLNFVVKMPDGSTLKFDSNGKKLS